MTYEIFLKPAPKGSRVAERMQEELISPEDAARMTGLTRSELAQYTQQRTFGLNSINRQGKTWYRADILRQFHANLQANRAAESLFR